MTPRLHRHALLGLVNAPARLPELPVGEGLRADGTVLRLGRPRAADAPLVAAVAYVRGARRPAAGAPGAISRRLSPLSGPRSMPRLSSSVSLG